MGPDDSHLGGIARHDGAIVLGIGRQHHTTVEASDVVITIGCGDACPYLPGKRYLDWNLEDPAGKDIEAVRRIRGDVRTRVEAPIVELAPTARPL